MVVEEEEEVVVMVVGGRGVEGGREGVGGAVEEYRRGRDRGGGVRVCMREERKWWRLSGCTFDEWRVYSSGGYHHGRDVVSVDPDGWHAVRHTARADAVRGVPTSLGFRCSEGLIPPEAYLRVSALGARKGRCRQRRTCGTQALGSRFPEL